MRKVLRSLFMKRATVTAIDDVANGFRLVTLAGPALQGVAWIPGQKVQVAMGGVFSSRTYTPLEWAATEGWTRILGYMHGDGPGSAWLRGLNVGAECEFFGPRSSLDARPLPGPLAVFGDETSIGVAYALKRGDHSRSIACYFEVGDTAVAEQVNATLDLETVTLFERRSDDAHMAQMEAALPALIEAGGSFVLTGKAGTIQRLHHELKRQGVSANRVVTKAYWTPGKAGLD